MTLEEFYEELLNNGKIDNNDAKALYNTLSAYNSELKRLSAHDAPRMMHKDYDNMFKLFCEAYEKSVNMSRQLENETPPFLSECIEKFSNQYLVMKTITDKKEYCTFNYAVNKETNRLIEGELSGHNVMKGAQSERYVVNGIDRNGKVITGLFTKAKKINYKAGGHFRSIADDFNYNGLGLPSGERSDSRNSAMSDIANLLGRDDLIAKATEMKYYDKQGNEMTGTFMNFVDATDINTISADKRERLYNVNVNDPFTSNAKRDALDLSIIDYLCGNIDRHGSNMMYKYKKCPDGSIRLNGIVGIDNDSSFGTKEIPENAPYTRLQALDDTVVISESMAKKLTKLTPQILSAVLKKNSIGQRSIDAALDRLKKLQERIEAGKNLSEYYKNKQNTEEIKKEKTAFLKNPIGSIRKTRAKFFKDNKKMPPHMIVTVPDDDIKDLNINSIAEYTAKYDDALDKVGICNILVKNHTQSYINSVKTDAERRQKTEKKRPPKLKLTNENIGHYCAKLGTYFRKIKQVNTDTPEYKTFLDTVKELAELCETVSKADKITSEDLNHIEKGFEKLQTNCASYLELNKLENESVGSKGYNRIKQVQKLKDEAAQYAEVFEKYKEKFDIFTREESLIADDKKALTANNRKEQPLPLGTIDASEIKIKFNDLFGSNYANDVAVSEWKTKTEAAGNIERGKLNWIKRVTDFDFPAKNEATNEFVVQLQDDCDTLCINYNKLIKSNPVDIDKWNTLVASLADNLKINLDQYNMATDFMYLDDPKMHALSSFVTAIQSKSEKIADKAMENLKNNKELNTKDPKSDNYVLVEDNRLEKLHNKLRYYSFNINNGAEKHSNSKEFLKMKDALDACANADSLSSKMLDDLSKASGEYLSKKTKGIHIRSFADPVREFRLDLAKTLKMVADSNKERIKSLPGAKLENEPEAKNTMSLS